RAPGSMDYEKVLARRREFAGRVARICDAIDALLIPAQPYASPSNESINALRRVPGAFAPMQRFTAPFDLTGHPTITFPANADGDGAPIASQLVARPLEEALLLRMADAFQRATGWHRRQPPVDA